eukprot:366450-Chlamydomonas_euryale.AAC.2
MVQKISQDGYLVVTWANWHYNDFVMTWVYHVKECGITGYIVGAMDDRLLKVCRCPLTRVFAGMAGTPALVTRIAALVGVGLTITPEGGIPGEADRAGGGLVAERPASARHCWRINALRGEAARANTYGGGSDGGREVEMWLTHILEGGMPDKQGLGSKLRVMCLFRQGGASQAGGVTSARPQSCRAQPTARAPAGTPGAIATNDGEAARHCAFKGWVPPRLAARWVLRSPLGRQGFQRLGPPRLVASWVLRSAWGRQGLKTTCLPMPAWRLTWPPPFRNTQPPNPLDLARRALRGSSARGPGGQRTGERCNDSAWLPRVA